MCIDCAQEDIQNVEPGNDMRRFKHEKKKKKAKKMAVMVTACQLPQSEEFRENFFHF